MHDAFNTWVKTRVQELDELIILLQRNKGFDDVEHKLRVYRSERAQLRKLIKGN